MVVLFIIGKPLMLYNVECPKLKETEQDGSSSEIPNCIMLWASENPYWSSIVILSFLHLIRTIATDMLHSMHTKQMTTPENLKQLLIIESCDSMIANDSHFLPLHW